MLLSRDEMLQLSGVQCVAEVLAQHAQYGHLLLKADIAGILSSMCMGTIMCVSLTCMGWCNVPFRLHFHLEWYI